MATLPTWIKPELASKINSLKLNHPELYDLLNLTDAATWKSFINDPACNDIPILNVTEFQQILIAQIFRPDLLLSFLRKAVVKMLDLKTMTMAKPSIKQMSEESDNQTPILLIASADSDPSVEIQDYKKNLNGNANGYVEMSIGKGLEEVASKAIRKAAEAGQWISLKNVHLISADWLAKLTQDLNSIKLSKDFRLWLICDSVKNFPESLLIQCNRVLYEPPSGVKNKLFRVMQQVYPTIAQRRDPKQIKLYVILFILNAVLQERRTYIPQGWTKWYDFGDSDLRTAISLVGWLEKSMSFKADWSILRGLCQTLAYGGRINNQQDLDILKTHLKEFFSNSSMNSYWQPLQMKLVVPQSQNLQDYLSAIAQLPDAETPENLGLSASTNLSKDLIICRNILKQLRSKLK